MLSLWLVHVAVTVHVAVVVSIGIARWYATGWPTISFLARQRERDLVSSEKRVDYFSFVLAGKDRTTPRLLGYRPSSTSYDLLVFMTYL